MTTDPKAPDGLTTVLFDVDGTLVDTNYLHTVCWWEAFRQAGHDVPSAKLHRDIGMGAGRLIQDILGERADREVAEQVEDAHMVLYRTYWNRLKPLPGATDLLRACAGRGLQVVLATSASEPELRALRATLDADEAVTAATSSAEVAESKPAPDLVRAALDRVGADPEQAVLVGDSVWDVEAGAKAGVRCLAVLTGGTSREELLEAGAAAVYPTPAELLADLDRALAAAGPG